MRTRDSSTEWSQRAPRSTGLQESYLSDAKPRASYLGQVARPRAQPFGCADTAYGTGRVGEECRCGSSCWWPCSSSVPTPRGVQDPVTFFDSNGLRIHFTGRGAGERVIFIHGFACLHRRHWEPPGIIAALTATGYRVIAMAYRRHGHRGSQRV